MLVVHTSEEFVVAKSLCIFRWLFVTDRWPHSTIYGRRLSLSGCRYLYLEQFTPSTSLLHLFARLPATSQDSSFYYFLSQSFYQCPLSVNCHISGLLFVLKILKFHSCPEIVLKSAIVLKFYSFGQNVLLRTFVMLSLHFFTSHDYIYVAVVECQVMFSLVTLCCSMCNIALITFLGLQYWSASMINIYEHRKTCIFCVLSLDKPTSVLK